MHERKWVANLLQITGFVFMVIALVGLIMFIWGSVSPGWFKVVGRGVGFRPAGLVLLFGGFYFGIMALAYVEVLRLLRAVAGRS